MRTRTVKSWPELREAIKQHLTASNKKLHSLTTVSGLSWGTLSTAFDPETTDIKVGTLTAILKAVDRKLTIAVLEAEKEPAIKPEQ